MITQNVLYSKTQQYIFFHFTNMNKFYFTRSHFTVQKKSFLKWILSKEARHSLYVILK